MPKDKKCSVDTLYLPEDTYRYLKNNILEGIKKAASENRWNGSDSKYGDGISEYLNSNFMTSLQMKSVHDFQIATVYCFQALVESIISIDEDKRRYDCVENFAHEYPDIILYIAKIKPMILTQNMEIANICINALNGIQSGQGDKLRDMIFFSSGVDFVNISSTNRTQRKES